MNKEIVKHILTGIRRVADQNEKLSINEVRIIVALERAVARLVRDVVLREHLVFKGGFVLFKKYDSSRFTRDADALAVAISKDEIGKLVVRALSADLDDGLWFGDIRVEELTEAGQYGAYRFDFAFQIGEPEQKKIHNLARLHVDIGFSDHVPPVKADGTMISVLAGEASFSWKVYPLEYIVAEKFQTLFERGSSNSRAKDIYDLIHLIPKCFDRKVLAEAIRNVFEHRKTPLPESFAKTAKGFDIVFLSQGWPGVKILEDKPTFEQAWQKLVFFLSEIDAIFSTCCSK